MKRSAVTSILTAIGMLALSAAPASAAPPVRFNTPEECVVLEDGITFCFEQSGQFIAQTTPSGVATSVGRVESRSAFYEDPEKQMVLIEFSDTQQFNFVARDDETKVFHLRTSFTEATADTTCTVTNHFIFAAGEFRHEDVDVNCS